MVFPLETLRPAPIDPSAEQVMVPMRDGVRLATDVYLPDGHGRVPAVLVRLPYDKCGRYTFMPACAPSFTERGYAFVVQDVRGKFRSEGETMPFVHEVEDGYDTIDWIVAQGWCERHGRHVGRLLLRLHPVGRGGQRPPRAQGDRAAGDERRPQGPDRVVGRRRRAALRRRLPDALLG